MSNPEDLSKQQCIEYVEEVYTEFKQHVLSHLTSGQLAQVDSLMSDCVALLAEEN